MGARRRIERGTLERGTAATAAAAVGSKALDTLAKNVVAKVTRDDRGGGRDRKLKPATWRNAASAYYQTREGQRAVARVRTGRRIQSDRNELAPVVALRDSNSLVTMVARGARSLRAQEQV